MEGGGGGVKGRRAGTNEKEQTELYNVCVCVGLCEFFLITLLKFAISFGVLGFSFSCNVVVRVSHPTPPNSSFRL